MQTTHETLPAGSLSRLISQKAIAWLILAIAEVVAISLIFDYAPVIPDRVNPVFYASFLMRCAALTLSVFVLLNWSRRFELVAEWNAIEAHHSLPGRLALNAVLFVATGLGAAVFTTYADTAGSHPWRVYPAFALLALAMALSLVHIALPLRGLAALLWRWRPSLLIAGVSGSFIALAAEAGRYLWDRMAEGTLVFTAAILRLYEKDVVIYPVERGIRVNEFSVQIWPTCSGYEGLVLVACFLTLYIWVFREQLRFPRVLVLYPIGLGAIWILNSVRIALLVTIGAHYSPEMAVKGFHSQAGWITFLLVALGMIALSRRLGLTRPPGGAAHASGNVRQAHPAAHVAETRYTQTVGHLAPFAAMMVGSIAMSTAAPHDQPVYVLKALLVVLALWWCRAAYSTWRPTPSLIGISSGLVVAIAWIATHQRPEGHVLGEWLATLGPALAVLWLAIRGLGTILLVPIAEELAFRGFLYRRLIRRDFFAVSPRAFSWLALIVSSVLFGVLHDRWLAGALAGAAFALVMCKTGRFSDAVVSHATANAAIFFWALAVRDWSLL